MERETRITITIPKEKEQDFRLFTVVNGGSIEKCESVRELTEKEKMIEIILKEEKFLWKAYKKAKEENGGYDGSTAAYRFRSQHDAILNLMDELEIERE